MTHSAAWQRQTTSTLCQARRQQPQTLGGSRPRMTRSACGASRLQQSRQRARRGQPSPLRLRMSCWSSLSAAQRRRHRQSSSGTAVATTCWTASPAAAQVQDISHIHCGKKGVLGAGAPFAINARRLLHLSWLKAGIGWVFATQLLLAALHLDVLFPFCRRGGDAAPCAAV